MLFGSLIILALLLLAAGIFMLDAIVVRLGGRETFIAVLSGNARIGPGSPVWIGGRAVGEVGAVEFLPLADDSVAHIAATLLVPSSLAEQVRRGSHVRVTSARRIGTPVVDIVPGPPTAGVIAPGDTLHMWTGVTTAQLMQAVNELRAEAAELTADAGALREPVAARAAALDRLVGRMAGIAASFDALADDFTNGPLGRMLGDPEFGTLLADLDATVAAVGAALERTGARLSDPEARRALADVRTRTAALQAQLAILRADIGRSGGGMLTRMQTDSAIAKALHGVRAQLDSLIAEVTANPMRFVF